MGFFGTMIEGYKIMGQESVSYIQNNKAQIASGVSIIGTIVSNVLSTKAGAKSARMIDAKEYELARPLTTKEKVQLCWQNHILPTAVAGTSCVSAAYSNNEHVKNFNRAATAYGAVKRLYDSTQRATKEVLGEKKAKEVQDKVNKKYIEEHPEVKEQLTTQKINPQPGVMVRFWEPVSGIDFYSTVDKIELAIKAMNAEMAAMPPRDASSKLSYRNGRYGIRITRFFELMDIKIPDGKAISEPMQNYGWNKGRYRNEDESIGAWYSPMTLNEDTMETCAAINWDTRPSDMRYGDYIKS